MPTYDYRCPNGHDFEHFFRKISDATAELACPQCGAAGMRRMSGGAGLVFKGSGFYLTDYGKNAHRKSGSERADAGDGSKGDSGGDAKAPVKAESSTGDSGGSSARSDSSTSGAAKPDGGKGSETKASSKKTRGGESK